MENIEETKERLGQVDNFVVSRIMEGEMPFVEVSTVAGNWKATFSAQSFAYGVVEKALEDKDAWEGLSTWLSMQMLLSSLRCIDPEFVLDFLQAVERLTERNAKREDTDESEEETLASLKAQYAAERESEEV